MARQKKKRFEVNASRYNIVDYPYGEINPIKGNWAKTHFKNNDDIVLELACGRGEYSTGLAPHFPDKNFVGIDIKGSRIWYGSTVAIDNNLENVAFLRTRIDLLKEHFTENEVSEIWITFPDPRPRDRDIKRRLTSPNFLDLYREILKPGGWIFFKTDNGPLFEFTLEVLKHYPGIADLEFTFDLYKSPLLAEHFDIKTKYELKFHAEGNDIKYMKFRLL